MSGITAKVKKVRGRKPRLRQFPTKAWATQLEVALARGLARLTRSGILRKNKRLRKLGITARWRGRSIHLTVRRPAKRKKELSKAEFLTILYSRVGDPDGYAKKARREERKKRRRIPKRAVSQALNRLRGVYAKKKREIIRQHMQKIRLGE